MTIKSASIRTAQVTALFGIALSVPLSSSAVGAPGIRWHAKVQWRVLTVIAMVP